MAAPLPSRSARGRRAPMADINVTPLVDVMLVLLVIFMVTAPLLTAGVPVNLPDSRAKAIDQDKQPVTLSIEANGLLHIDNDEVSEAALPGRLQQIAATGAGGQAPQVYLRADRALDYGRVARVLGELAHAGLTKVALLSTEASGAAGAAAAAPAPATDAAPAP